METRKDIIDKDYPDITGIINEKIKKGEELYFLPSSVVDETDPRLNYKLYIFGSLQNGYNACVILIDIPVFIDIKSDELPGETVEEKIRNLKLLSGNRYISNYETVSGHLINDGFAADYEWIRVYFNNTRKRTSTIEILKGFKLSNCDCFNDYHRLASRQFDLSLAQWVVIKNYTFSSSSNFPRCNFVFDVSFRNYTRVQPENIPKYININYPKDPTLVMSWDIETIIEDADSYDVALPENSKSHIFIICCNLHWGGSYEPIRKYSLATKPYDLWISEKDDDVDKNVSVGRISECIPTERELILKFGEIIGKTAPNIITGFNDGNYDWPFVLKKAKINGYLTDFFNLISLKPLNYYQNNNPERMIKDRKMEITPQRNIDIYYHVVPSYVLMDIRRLCIKNTGDKEEISKGESLKVYLVNNKLPSKYDLPFKKMKEKYFENNISEVVHYCTIDALSCHRLLVKRQFLEDQRIQASMSYTTIDDMNYKSNQGRILNMLVGYTIRYPKFNNLLCDLRYKSTGPKKDKKDKVKLYPGGYVFFPKVGLKNKNPIISFDFNSLYPSLIMTNNFTHEMLVKDNDYFQSFQEKHPNLRITNVEFLSKDQPLTGKFVRHSIRDRKIDKEPEIEMGLLPFIENDLMVFRKSIKNNMAEMSKKIKSMDDSCEEKSELEFLRGVDNIKQNAVKTFMNSIYGICGASSSPLFCLEIAGGVTTYGKMVINHMADFVEKFGFKVVYGDTDSIYLEPPDSFFENVYKTDMQGKINAALSAKDFIQEKINEEAKIYSGSDFLVMAYEKTMLPAVFTGKKKYYGLVRHGEGEGFVNKKGTEDIKKGKPNIMKIISKIIVDRSLEIDNKLSMLEIVKETLENVKTMYFNISDFSMTDIYRPGKKRADIIKFKERINNKDTLNPNDKEPEPNERFVYVVAKDKFNNVGNSGSKSKGCKIEYFSNITDIFQIDRNYYYQKYLVSFCARFVCGDVAGMDVMEKYESTSGSFDKKLINEAKKIITPFVVGIVNKRQQTSLIKKISKNNDKRPGSDINILIELAEQRARSCIDEKNCIVENKYLPLFEKTYKKLNGFLTDIFESQKEFAREIIQDINILKRLEEDMVVCRKQEIQELYGNDTRLLSARLVDAIINSFSLTIKARLINNYTIKNLKEIDQLNKTGHIYIF